MTKRIVTEHEYSAEGKITKTTVTEFDAECREPHYPCFKPHYPMLGGGYIHTPNLPNYTINTPTVWASSSSDSFIRNGDASQ